MQALVQSSGGSLPEGFLVSADFQLAGRGQKGNRWESNRSENLMFSVFWAPKFLPARHAFWLSAAAAIAVAEVLAPFVPEIRVKWPNDLMVNDLKIGGILIENAIQGQHLERSIVGIGLNINQTEVLPSATSLRLETKIISDREEILEKLRIQLALQCAQLRISGWEKMRMQYYKKLYKMAIPHDYHLPDGTVFRAVIKGISESGELMLITSQGEKRFDFKEVGF